MEGEARPLIHNFYTYRCKSIFFNQIINLFVEPIYEEIPT